jgi:signal transduction histidine kinase
MKLNRLKKWFGSGYSPFSPFWLKIVQTRFFLCFVIGLFSVFDPKITQQTYILSFISVYIAFNILLGLLSADTLQVTAIRVIPSILDVFFISLIIYFTGGPDNSWFLIYLFPIISVSRYLGYRGGLMLAAIATVAYLFVYMYAASGLNLDAYSFALRCSIFFGIAAVVGNLARTNQVEEGALLSAFEEINNAMLSGMSQDKVFDLILKKGLQVTGSETGHIKLLNRKTGVSETVAAVGQIRKKGGGMKSIAESYSDKVMQSKEPLIISDINRIFLNERAGLYLKLYVPRPRSALFLPLVYEDTALGAIAVFSRSRFYYRKKDLRRLRAFASLIAMAQKHAGLYKELQDRLKLLHYIGEQLKAGQNLNDLFDEVVKLTINQLDSEEASLFVPDPQNPQKIVKAAVCGPNKEATKALGAVELSYLRGESFVGHIYQNKEVIFENQISQDVDYVKDYENAIPSKRISHYIGVPLFIGHEILGVIRVINKRASNYSSEHKIFTLSGAGFEQADVELMQTIASQVSVAIKNASLLETEKLAALGKLAHTVGHDIKTEIATALNYLEVLSFESEDDEENDRLKTYTYIEDALHNSVDKLQNLLLAAKPKPPQMSESRMEDIFLGLEEHMERQAVSKHIEFSIQYPGGEYEFLADIGQMQQVMSNLFDNSLYAINKLGNGALGRSGRITVKGEVNESYLKLYWEDNGCGIPEQNVPKIFVPFYTNKKTGNGLGLFIVKTIIENHGGSLSVNSQEGQGTQFEIKLPLLAGAAGQSEGSRRRTINE